MTKLTNAIKNGDVEEVRNLLAEEVDIEEEVEYDNRDLYGSALAWASYLGKLELVQLLIAAGANINKQDGMKERTPLMWASTNGHLDIMRELLAQGAEMEVYDENSMSPLIWAIRGGYWRDNENILATRLLIDAGADVNGVGEEWDKNALREAVQEGHVNTLKTLIASGARVDHVYKDGNTALIDAVYFERLDIIEALIAAGADVTKTNAKGQTALILALEWTDEQQMEETLHMLINAGAEPDEGKSQLSGDQAGNRYRIFKAIRAESNYSNQDLDNKGPALK